MNCQQCQEMMIDYWGGHLTQEQRSLFDAHLAACPTCSRDIESAGLIPYLVRCKQDVLDRNAAAVLSRVRGAKEQKFAAAMGGFRQGPRIMSFTRFLALAASLLLVFGVHWLLTQPSTENRMASLTTPTSKSQTSPSPSPSPSMPHDNVWEDVESGPATLHARELGRNSNDKNDSSDWRWEGSIYAGSAEQCVPQDVTTLACAVLTAPKPTDIGSLAFNLSAESDARQAIEPFLSRQVVAVFSPDNGELFGTAYTLDRKRGLYVGPIPSSVKTVLFEWITTKENRLILAEEFVAEAEVVSYDETTGLALLYCGALRDPDVMLNASAMPLSTGQADLPVVGFRKTDNGNPRLMEGVISLTVSEEKLLMLEQENLTLPVGSAILSEDRSRLIGMAVSVGSGAITILARAKLDTFLGKSQDEWDRAERRFLERVGQLIEHAKQTGDTASGSPTSENVDGRLICRQADGYQILAIDSDKNQKPDFCIHSAHPGLIRVIPPDTATVSGAAMCESLGLLWAGATQQDQMPTVNKSR